MKSDNTARKHDDLQEDVPVEKKLTQLYSLIDGIETAMMTTRALDGSLVSRPMQVQKRDPGTDLWFMTTIDSGKIEEIQADPHVNLGFYKDGSREWVSVNGRARISQNREQIARLYKPDWKAWLPDEGGDKDGSERDPRIALIEVDAVTATYLKTDAPAVVNLFKIAKSMVTGTPPQIGKMGELNQAELNIGPGRAAK